MATKTNWYRTGWGVEEKHESEVLFVQVKNSFRIDQKFLTFGSKNRKYNANISSLAHKNLQFQWNSANINLRKEGK